MRSFFKGVIITFVVSILNEITSFFISAYRQQFLLFLKWLTVVMMLIVVGVFMISIIATIPPMPVIVILTIISYIIFKWLRKANQILSLELEKMKRNKN